MKEADFIQRKANDPPEWLGAMVVARVVDLAPDEGTFLLPAEHARFLSRASGADNLGIAMQFIAGLGGVEDDVGRVYLIRTSTGIEKRCLARDVMNNWYVVRE